jgi:hypothetical protein
VRQSDFFEKIISCSPLNLVELFIEPFKIDAVFIKVLTTNDDSGKHGILIPKEAYDLFPPFEKFVANENNTIRVTTIWRRDSCEGGVCVDSRYKYYKKYPERRLTRLRQSRLQSVRPENALFVLGRRKGCGNLFEAHVLYPEERAYSAIWAEIDLEQHPSSGLFYLDRDWSPSKQIKESEAIVDLLKIFEGIRSQGYIRTMRPGSTGVGYTFESLAGIKENNSREADYKGIEIKTFRSKDSSFKESKKQDLFLKEPVWLDGLSAVGRILSYGYIDVDHRYAWYSTVKNKVNSHGLRVGGSKDAQELLLFYEDKLVASWSREAIQKRLLEKLSELVIVSARTRGFLASEEFLYETLMHCKEPSVDAFFEMVCSGSVLIEIRMHVGAGSRCRNHGTSFRVLMRDLGRLFNSVKLLRDAP